MTDPMFRLVVLCVAALSLAAPARDATRQFESSFARGTDRYSLHVIVREATLSEDIPGELALFTVRRNGEHLYPVNSGDGAGRLVGCRFGHRSPSRVRVAVFPSESDPVGWVVTTGETCGNTWAARVKLVTVDTTASASDRRYEETEFVAKSCEFRRAGDLVEVWSTYQDWGSGGTVSSVLVPELRVIDTRGAGRRVALPADVSAWSYYADASFTAVFMAGVRELNVGLLEHAMANLWDPNAMTGQFGLPTDESRLREIVERVRALSEAQRELSDRLVGAASSWPWQPL